MNELTVASFSDYDISIYHGYPVISATACNGWYFGALSDSETGGDGYVVAPDGSRADLLWQIGFGDLTQVLPPGAERWGVYAVWFPKPITTVEDLVFGFRFVLPELQKIHLDLA